MSTQAGDRALPSKPFSAIDQRSIDRRSIDQRNIDQRSKHRIACFPPIDNRSAASII